ncbi:MAG: site-specific integrase, partial [Legionellales bacterium]
DGEAPIYVRITVDGQRAMFSLNRHIHPDKWSSEAGKAKGIKEDIKELNSYIDTVRNKIKEHQRDLLDHDKLITAENLKNAFLGLHVKKYTLLQLFEHHNKEMGEKVGKDFSKNTMTRYDTTLMHIKNFLNEKYAKSDIFLSELEYKFITDLEHWFKTVRKCNHNSTLKYIRNFRKIINIAVSNDWLVKDPFMKYKSKLEETERDFLSADELQTIEKKKFAIARLDEVRDVFVFACYTGLAYVDLVNLTSDNIKNGIDKQTWLFTHRTKTKIKSNIPLLPPALAIIEKYKNHPEARRAGTLFPPKSNQRLNSYLKEVADLCEITKNLTFHVARHTFATTVTLTNGVPIESVSAMLGHNSIRTTQIYAKVVERKVSDDMAKLKGKLFKHSKRLKVVND